MRKCHSNGTFYRSHLRNMSVSMWKYGAVRTLDGWKRHCQQDDFAKSFHCRTSPKVGGFCLVVSLSSRENCQSLLLPAETLELECRRDVPPLNCKFSPCFVWIAPKGAVCRLPRPVRRWVRHSKGQSMFSTFPYLKHYPLYTWLKFMALLSYLHWRVKIEPTASELVWSTGLSKRNGAKFRELSQNLPKLADCATHWRVTLLGRTGVGIFKQGTFLSHNPVVCHPASQCH